ncbi:MAG: RNA ligase family protein [Polyangia bacterium]
MPTNHVAWGSIELLHNVVRTLTLLNDQYQGQNQGQGQGQGQPFPVVRYRAKVKLHGSNCAVQVTEDGVHAQSRTSMLTPEADYKGFAAFVRANEGYFRSLRPGCVLFGEWCGPGVEKGMAISQARTKIFALFAVRVGERLVYEPEEIRALVPDAPEGVHVLPWEGDEVSVDFGSRAQLDAVAAEVSARVAAVEREDPWVRSMFGISGLGEGLVLYPVSVNGQPPSAEPERLGQLMWKAKGEKHRTAGAKAAAQVSATVAASVDEFVSLLVTEARLEQGLGAVCGGVRDPRATGRFLAWVGADVQKESVAELEASGLTWQSVEKAVQARARSWFQKKP